MGVSRYRDERWFSFRARVLELDGNRCTRCSRAEADGVTLQCHHKTYTPGRRPWEYDVTDCETLCKGCHAREHGKLPPSDGWSLVCETDNLTLGENCELCGTEIRYEFTIVHPGWGEMVVGSQCVLGLTAESAETYREIIRRRGQLSRFLADERWVQNRATRSAPAFKSCQFKGHKINLWWDGAGYRLQIKIKKRPAKTGTIRYESEEDAKARAFEVLELSRAI